VLVGAPVALRSEDLTAYLLASDVKTGDTVVELEIPAAMEGKRFVLAWNTADGKAAYVPFLARAGTHTYEMRNGPAWKGTIKQLAISLEGVHGRVKTPTLADEVDLFFSPEWFQLSTINGLTVHTLFGFAWGTALLLLFVLSVFALRLFRKKPWSHALILGFVISWAVSDLRLILDHVSVVQAQERHPFVMHPYIDAKAFADEAAGMIDTTWTRESIGEGENFVWYRLAERPFVSRESSTADTYWVGKNNKEPGSLLQRGDFRLFKKNRP